ncbi:MAG TPA: hypothetical protein VEZ88_09045 [Steroidobacteraceae bacterium]|nr:hypothetical protein [Steroidobacteraceae bacterium]
MSERNDQDWLDALAGRAGVDAASSDAREARALREGMLQRAVEEPAPVGAIDLERENALIARARREGLVGRESARQEPQPRAPAWMMGWRSSLAFAASVTLAIALAWWLQPNMTPETVRGVELGIVRIQASDPAALKEQLIEELRAVGIEATGYAVLNRQGIDADLPLPLTPRVRGVLERHRIPVPADGVLRVEIISPAER